MKIIHCADLHINSKLETNLNKKNAEIRKKEILRAFGNLVSYARGVGASNILIAGDLFDVKKISVTSINYVKDVIEKNPDINFYYLRGNHDSLSFTSSLESIPKNLFLFKNEWTSYMLSDKVKLSAIEFDASNYSTYFDSLSLNPSDINIVMLHGQIGDNTVGEELIPLKRLAGKEIDYLALGHIHTFAEGRLDERGRYCYSGCLEGRGFDEIGEKGISLVDIDEANKSINFKFIPMSTRIIYKLDIDMKGIKSQYLLETKVSELANLNGVREDDMLEVVLKGECDSEFDKEFTGICDRFQREFFSFKLKDESVYKLDPNRYINDKSLKGEIINAIYNQSDIDDAKKATLVRMAIKAMEG